MKKSGWIAMFILIFQLSALSLLMVASVCFAFTSGDAVIATAMIPLFIIAASLLAIHLVRSFGKDALDKHILENVALVFLVLFLVLFVTAVIYYYMARSFATESIPEEPSTMEDEVVIVDQESVHEGTKSEPGPETEPEPFVVPSEPVPVPETVQLPDVPSKPSLKATFDVPSKPSFTATSRDPAKVAPAPATVTSWAYLYEPYASQYSFDDDFWADFYVQGEDELTLEPGLYYFELVINSQAMGEIELQVQDGEYFLQTDVLRDGSEDILSKSAFERVFSQLSEEFISVNLLEAQNIGVTIDTSAYVVYVDYAAADIPVKTISITDSGYRPTARGISGAVVLDPVSFIWKTRYNLYLSLDNAEKKTICNNIYGNLSLSNYLRLKDIHFNFNMGVSLYNGRWTFSLRDYLFHVDFPSHMIRLSWGNISTDLLSPNGNTLGIRFDKALAYAPIGYKNRSHVTQLIEVEKQSDVVIYNEGREIFRRTLETGTYSLRDFILYSGANHIVIDIIPLDGSQPETVILDVDYASSLLAPGEVYYGAALATGREILSSRGSGSPALAIPFFNEQFLVYDFRNITFSSYVNAGMTRSTTLYATMALQNRPSYNDALVLNGRFAVELLNANMLGTTRNVVNFYLNDEDSLRLTYKLSHQLLTGRKTLSAVTAGMEYDSPEFGNWTSGHYLKLSIGFSGTLSKLGWSANGGISFDDAGIGWNASGSLSMRLGRNVSISGSMNMTAKPGSQASISGSIYGTISFSHVNASTYTNLSSVSSSVSIYGPSDSLYANVYTDSPLDKDSYDLSANYSHSGKLFDFGASFFGNGLLSSAPYLKGGLTLSTESVLADGIFAIQSNFPSSFLLIRQDGILAGNDLSAAYIGAYSGLMLDSFLGTAVYSNVSSSGVTLYSSSGSSFGGSTSFDFGFAESRNREYAVRLNADDMYSAFGVVTLKNGQAYSDASSPLYAIALDDGEIISMESLDSYVFTDSAGVLIVQELEPGSYGFDIKYGMDWYLCIFEIREDRENVRGIQVLENQIPVDIEAHDTYAGVYMFDNRRTITEDEFWAWLYPGVLEENI